MQINYVLLVLALALQLAKCGHAQGPDKDQQEQSGQGHWAHLKVGNEIVFDSMAMDYANLTTYPDQFMFTLMDGEGQNITITFAGKDISQRRPKELTFNSPGLFHGFSEKQDVFFLAFGKLVADRAPGQIKYERHLPQTIMEGKLRVVSWTEASFEFVFEGKLGHSEEVDTPETWLPFTGHIKAGAYVQFN